MKRQVDIHQVGKELRPLFQLALEQGWRHRRTSNMHLQWIPPKGAIVLTPMHLTKGNRGFENAIANLKRVGLFIKDENALRGDVPPPPPAPPPVIETHCGHGNLLTERCLPCEEIAHLRRLRQQPVTTPAVDTAVSAALNGAEPMATPTPTLVLAPSPDLRSMSQRVQEALLTVCAAHPHRKWRTNELALQVRGRISESSYDDVRYALRMLRTRDQLLNPQHGVWVYPTFTPKGFISLPPEEPMKPTVSLAPAVAPIPTAAPKVHEAAPAEPLTDIQKLDRALEAIMEIEAIVRRTREAVSHLDALKGLLGGR